MRARLVAASALVGLTVLTTLTGCGADAEEAGDAGNQADTAASAPSFGEGDVAFVLESGSALTSLLLAAQRASTVSPDPEVRRLAEEIAAATGPRVDQVARWVRVWGEQGAALGHDAAPHGEATAAGFTPEVVARLQSLPRHRFDAAFLAALVDHLEATESVLAEEIAVGRHPGAAALAEQAAADGERWLREARRLAKGSR